MAVTGHVRKVTATYEFPDVTIDLMEAHKPWDCIVRDNGVNPEHTIGAEMSNAGSLQSSWRYVGSVGPRMGPCDPLSYVPAQVPWGTEIEGRGTALGIACRFSSEYFYGVTGIGEDWSNVHLKACRDLSSMSIKNILRNIYREICDPGFASDVVINSLSRVMLVELARYFQSVKYPEDDIKNGVFGKVELLRIHEMVDGSLGQNMSVHRIAKAMGYSEGHFYNIFKNSTGTTPRKYIENLRINKAIDLIREGNLSMKQIAYSVGFSNPSSFSVAFRRKTGSPPSQAERIRNFPISCAEN